MSEAQYLLGLHLIAGAAWIAWHTPRIVENRRFDKKFRPQERRWISWSAVAVSILIGPLNFLVRAVVKEKGL